MDLINKDLIFVITFGLYTKFIEAESEHTCGKTQVSPALSVAAWERTFDFFLKFFEKGVPIID
jgi:hypothetical protein